MEHYLSPSQKQSPKFVLVFLLLHGALFLGIEYILFQSFPIFMLIHAVLGIAIYLLFWRASFPRVFRDIFIGAAISLFFGVLFGDILLEKFFFLYEEIPGGPISKLYSAVVVFYIYFYCALLKRTIYNK